jgi:hypothetical protein
MTEPISALPNPTETTEVLRFLRRFADLMSNGSNSDNLLRAARLLETYCALLKETHELLQAERVKGDATAEARKALEAAIKEQEQANLALTAGLNEQQLRADNIVAEMERRQGEFLQRAEQAEAQLAERLEMAPAIAAGFVAVPLATLKMAKAQFESLAAAFEKSGNIVSQVMCEASATTLDRVILEAGVAVDADDHAQEDAA